MKGSCLCGLVTITSTDRTSVDVCHCGMCRRWGGGPMFAIECEQVEIDGREHVASYRSSDWAERGFCRDCGTHLYYRFLESGSYAVPAGLFQDMQGLELTGQIFIDKKPGYYALANKTSTMTEDEVIKMYGGEE